MKSIPLTEIGENAEVANLLDSIEADTIPTTIIDSRSDYEAKMDKVMLQEKKLYVLVNVLNSGVTTGGELTRDVTYAIKESSYRSTIEDKIMAIIATIEV